MKYHLKLSSILLMGAMFLPMVHSDAQQKENYAVAIFLYNGVELLDFAGPGEVFSASGFKVYTMSADGNEIISQGFVTVKPQYSVENAPKPDIVVFPGGGAGAPSKDPRVIGWLKSNVSTGTMAMSVCTGAQILAKAGLLEGYNVTTFHNFIDGLQAMLPNSKVLRDTRFVDNGMVVTTAGVSAGIDGALHLVSRIKGLEAAKATAYYMEYDKWKPEEGRIDYKNETLEKMKAGAALDKENKSVTIGASSVPFEGEIINLASSMVSKGEYDAAAKVLEAGIKWYPNSSACYRELSRVYKKGGKSAPPEEETFLKLIEQGNVDEAVTLYDRTQKQFPGWILFGENNMNMTGYHIMAKGNYDLAIKVFQLNAKAFPKSANAFDSLAEGYMKAGRNKEAKENYQKSLEMDPSNHNAKEMLAKLK
jgi:putative intracellular protease/amidase/Tfp pilus assembly protein PilF